MPEAVIVAATRSPIGRANKGSLVDVPARRPHRHDHPGGPRARCPQLDPNEIEDVIVGCGQPGGESGYNVARVAAILAGVDVPGVTVNRYCSSSLQAIRMASARHQGGRGRRVRLRRRRDGQPLPVRRVRHRPAQPAVRGRRVPHRRAHQRRVLVGTAVRAFPTSTSPWVRPPRTSAWPRTSAARRWTSSRRCRSSGRSSRRRTGSSSGRSRPITLSDGTVVTKDDGPRDGTTVEKLAELKPVFRPDGEITAGNACPLNDGAAAVVVMSDTRAKSLGIDAARLGSSPAACRRSTRRSWASARSRRAVRRSSVRA